MKPTKSSIGKSSSFGLAFPFLVALVLDSPTVDFKINQLKLVDRCIKDSTECGHVWAYLNMGYFVLMKHFQSLCDVSNKPIAEAERIFKIGVEGMMECSKVICRNIQILAKLYNEFFPLLNLPVLSSSISKEIIKSLNLEETSILMALKRFQGYLSTNDQIAIKKEKSILENSICFALQSMRKICETAYNRYPLVLNNTKTIRPDYCFVQSSKNENIFKYYFRLDFSIKY